MADTESTLYATGINYIVCLQHWEQKLKRSPHKQRLFSSGHIRGQTSPAPVSLHQPEGKRRERLGPGLGPWSATATSFLPPRKQLTDRQRDGWMAQNYSSTSILRINIAFKNTASSQEQRNQQVQQGAAGKRHVGLLDLEPVLRKTSSALCSCSSICGFSVRHRLQGPPFDVFIHMYCVSCL